MNILASTVIVGALLAQSYQAAETGKVLEFRLDEPSQPCVQDNGSARRWCSMPEETADEENRCFVSVHKLCSGEIRAGHGSICIHTLVGSVIRCEEGQWVSKGSQRPAAKLRERRWWWGRRRQSRHTVQNDPPTITCPADIARTASCGSNNTIVDWSTPSASVPTVSRIQGPAPGSTFNAGSFTIGYEARDSHGATAQCYFIVTVTVLSCPPLPIILNGARHCVGLNLCGSECTHTCGAGYTLSGNPTAICQANEQWATDFPSCQRVSCGAPTGVQGGELLCPEGHLYTDTCTIQCRPGYQHTGQTTITCTSSGTWTSADRCRDVEAPQFPDSCPADQGLFSGPLASAVSVTWPDPVVTDNSEHPVNLTSSPIHKGSLLEVGSHTVTITATDQAGNRAVCTFSITVTARECAPFQPPSNGIVTCTRGFVEGSICTVVCRTGHRVQGQGETSIMCLDTQLWNATMGECEAIACSDLPVVSNGHFSCPHRRQYLDVCILTCDIGFNTTEQSILCQADGTWTTPGVCADVQPPVFDNGCPSNIHVFAQRLGQPTYVSWTSPAVSDNSGHDIDVRSDTTSGSAFDLNTTVVTFEATDVSGNTNTCQMNVTVTALKCSDPADQLQPITDDETSSSHSPMLSTCLDGHVFGACCMLACSNGYRLQGSGSVTCESDARTHPPAMGWEWTGGSPLAKKPLCKEDPCPPLSPPQHGALSCYLGDRGWLCFLHCEAAWDVPARTDGQFICTPEAKVWVPSSVPNCDVRHLPDRTRILSDLLYFSHNCSVSQAQLRQHFISYIEQTLYGVSCSRTPSCVVENIQVICSPVSSRRRRHADADVKQMRRIHQARSHSAVGLTSHYVLVSFEVVMPYVEGSRSPEDAFKHYHQVAANLTVLLKSHAGLGHLNADHFGLLAARSTVGSAKVKAECPPNTLPRTTPHQKRFSCVAINTGD